MTFSFSLYVVLLLVTLVTYFRTKLGNLVDKRLLEDSKIYCC